MNPKNLVISNETRFKPRIVNSNLNKDKVAVIVSGKVINTWGSFTTPKAGNLYLFFNKMSLETLLQLLYLLSETKSAAT